MGIRNTWILNVDELLVADKLKNQFSKKKFEVLFPLNAQMKDIDLVLIKLKNNKAITFQVKGSRTYEPTKPEVVRYGIGGAAWFRINKNSIFKASNKVDFYLFVLHSLVDGKTKKEIKIDYLIFPKNDFLKYCKNKKARKGGFYHFIIWIDSNKKRSFDFREDKEKPYQLSKFINNWALIK